VRAIVAFAQTTAARGRVKVVVVHPAERMNAIAANTLLKTLEEPPGGARFVLCTGAPDALLPTIRSRCQALPMLAPPADEAMNWLAERGVDGAAVLLAATGGQALEALEWSQQGIDAALWLRLPGMVARGEGAAFTGWPLPRLIDSLQKLCHDCLCVAVGARPRYFPSTSLGQAGSIVAVSGWARSLAQAARTAEHPWHGALMVESLFHQGKNALSASTAARHRP
jgi:DNA polymerase-3 subunit delta'